MTILITGAAGFIGSHLTDMFLRQGLKVVGIDNLSNGSRENLDTAFRYPNFTFLCRDLKEHLIFSDLFNAQKFDVVIHLAARNSVPKSIDNPMATFKENVEVTNNLFLAAIAFGIPNVFYASSSSVYGESESKLKSEDLPSNPLNPYGLSKSVNEQYAKVYSKIGLNACGLRFFNVFGPRQKIDYLYGAVIPKIIDLAVINNNPINVYGDGEQTRDFTYIHDLCAAIGKLVNVSQKKQVPPILNVCGKEPKSINDLIKSMVEISGRQIFRNTLPPRPGDINQSCGDNLLLEKTIGPWESTNFNIALRNTIAFYKNRKQLKSGSFEYLGV